MADGLSDLLADLRRGLLEYAEELIDLWRRQGRVLDADRRELRAHLREVYADDLDLLRPAIGDELVEAALDHALARAAPQPEARGAAREAGHLARVLAAVAELAADPAADAEQLAIILEELVRQPDARGPVCELLVEQREGC